MKRTPDMTCRGTRPVRRAIVAGALSFSAVVALAFNPALTPVLAAGDQAPIPAVAGGSMKTRFLALGVGKSVVVDLPDIKDVLVADPKIANAVVHSGQRAYIIGAAGGQTNIIFFGSARPQNVAASTGC